MYYGKGTPRDALIELAADDGSDNRDNRNNILNTDYSHFAGCYGDHGGFYGKMAVGIYYGNGCGDGKSSSGDSDSG